MSQLDQWELIYRGTTTCLGIQFLVLSILKLTQTSVHDKIIGSFILLLSLSYLKPIFISTIVDNIIMRTFLINGIEIFFPPLLYLYIKSIADKVKLH